MLHIHQNLKRALSLTKHTFKQPKTIADSLAFIPRIQEHDGPQRRHWDSSNPQGRRKHEVISLCSLRTLQIQSVMEKLRLPRYKPDFTKSVA